MNESIKAKLKKLAALSERGFHGEKTAAKKQLLKLLEKYNISIDEIIEKESEYIAFNCYTKWEKDLLFQIYYKVKNTSQVTFKKWKKAIYLDLTPIEAAEVKYLLKLYKKDFAKFIKEESDILFRAYVIKNRIFSEAKDKKAQQEQELTLEEKQRLRKIANTMFEMERLNVRKAIGE
jgi:hypothetical protein